MAFTAEQMVAHAELHADTARSHLRHGDYSLATAEALTGLLSMALAHYASDGDWQVRE